MICECTEKVCDNSLQNFKETHPKAIDPEITLVNEAIIFNRKEDSIVPEDMLYIPLEINYHEKTKKGDIKSKKHKVHVLASYCPFCGKKLKEGE